MGSGNKRRRYIVTSFNGWAHTQNDPVNVYVCDMFNTRAYFTPDWSTSPVTRRGQWHICVSESVHHWSRYWLGFYAVRGRYLNQWWLIICLFYATPWIPMNKLRRNLKQNLNISIQWNAFWNIFCKIAAILSRPQCDNNCIPDAGEPAPGNQVYTGLRKPQDDYSS